MHDVAPSPLHISTAMASRHRRACQFLHALAAILLVTCSYTSQASTDVSKANVIASTAIDVNPDEVGSGSVGEGNSPQELLRRGTMLLLHEGGAKEAVRVLEVAVTLWQEEFGTGKLQTSEAASAAQRLGEALALEGDHGRSADFYALAVDAFESLFGAGSQQMVESMTGLGVALLHQGKGPEAAAILEEAMWARAGSKLNKGSIEGMSRNLGALMEALVRRGSEGDGDGGQELEGALAGVEKINLLAWRFFVQQWPFEGQMVMQESLDAIESDEGGGSYPPAVRDLLVSAYLYNLGFLRLAVLGEYKSAVEVLSRAQELRSTILGDLHPLTVQAVVSRGHALTLTGETYLAVGELTRTANGLLETGQAAKAETLARQALRSGYEPLGTHTYAHACFTQYLNMLKGWGKEGQTRANDFQTRQVLIARRAQLTIKQPVMVAASKALAKALATQIEEEGAPALLKLSGADKEVLWEEWDKIRKLVHKKGHK